VDRESGATMEVTERHTSYRRLVAASSMVGGASVVSLALAVLRMKVAALALGPVGIGLIGLLNAVIGAVTAVVGLGVANAASRQIAASKAERGDIGEVVVRRALFWTTMLLAMVGGAAILAAAPILARYVLSSNIASAEVPWLAVGVVLTLIAAAQTGMITGLGRVRDVAKLTVGASVIATVVAMIVIFQFRLAAVWTMVLAGPASGVLAGTWFAIRAPRPPTPRAHWSELAAESRSLVKLGSAMMAGGLIGSGGLLAIRAVVGDQLGLDALGQFQASWAIATTYLGLVLAAMTTDYFPRLSALIATPAEANLLVNHQTEVALLLGGPIIVVMIAVAPWLLQLLYADKFAEAASILRWQLLGDVFRIASWPLTYVLVASARGILFVTVEFVAMAAYLLSVWVLVPRIGVLATGVGYWVMFLPYLPLVYILARQQTGFAWSASVRRDLMLVAAAATAAMLLASWSDVAAASGGIAIALGLAGRSFSRLRRP
jgi:O-antigen/teichoic acid export membrane protein